SQLADQRIAEVFERFPELIAVAIIRDHKIQLPRGSTELKGGDQLLIGASETKSVEAFRQLADNRASQAISETTLDSVQS
ncbi:MAG TPA: TrkA C-terminal domain-containing protein, partial [Candidatus Udaeobacter sp.]|nr:TrkA C-terminal domain-containing protein [Candidatus Udaeobacter sp.]